MNLYFNSKKNQLFCFLSILCLGLVSCEGEASNKAIKGKDESPFVLNRPKLRFAEISKDDPFASMRMACEEANGFYIENQALCSCGYGYTFDYSDGKSSCLEMKKGEKLYESSQTSIASRYFEFDAKEKLSNFIGVPSRSFMSLIIPDKKTGYIDREDMIYLFNNQREYDINLIRHEGDLVFYRNDYGALTNLEYQFNPFQLSDDFQNYEFGKGSEEKFKTVNMILQVIKEKPESQKVIEISDEGCLQGCRLIKKWRLSSGLQINQEKLYLNGGVAQNRIVFDKDGKIYQLVLDPSDRFNHLIETSQKLSQNQFLQETSIYGDSLDLIVQDPLVSQFDVSDKVSARQLIKPDAFSSKIPQVVVCESGGFFPWLKDNPDTVIFGPNKNKSLMGWSDDSRYYFDTVKNLDSRSGLTFFENNEEYQQTLDSHGYAVISRLSDVMENEKVKVAGISTKLCMDIDSNWDSSILRHSKARTVNASFNEVFDPDVCKNSPIAQKIRKTENQLLWVFAAGNYGTDLDVGRSDSCPQTIVAQKNLIKVSSGSLNGIDRYSNYGHLSSDIVANGSAPGGISGTSFAAPLVSKIAAMINHRFPNLTPEQVKKTLLFSVDFNQGNPLPVTSGGVLNPERALQMAQALDENDYSDEKWIKKTYCKYKLGMCDSAESRISYWSRTGLWKSTQ